MTKTYTNEEIMVELQEIKSMLRMLIENPKPKRMPVEEFQPDVRTRGGHDYCKRWRPQRINNTNQQ